MHLVKKLQFRKVHSIQVDVHLVRYETKMGIQTSQASFLDTAQSTFATLHLNERTFNVLLNQQNFNVLLNESFRVQPLRVQS